MKNLRLKLLVLLCAVFVVYSCNDLTVNDELLENVPELKSASIDTKSYIVVLDDAELNTELAELKGYEKKQAAVKTKTHKILKRAGIPDGEIGHVYGTALKGFSVKIPPGQLKKLESDPSVKYIEENQIISLIQPESVTVSADISIAGQTIPWGITRVNGGENGNGKTAWVIDTGIDLDHEDLNVDGSKGWNFITNTQSADDDHGHGTHCAGIIGALDNGLGVIGVAAGATVIPVKVLAADGSGTTEGVIAGVDYVAANASDGNVANMSLGGGISTALDEAVLNASTYEGKNILFALAAGNERNNANFHSPARVNGPNIYTIAAFNEGDIWASYSNYGMPPVDYCEPGTYIYSTYKNNAYTTMSGTSMATPHMAGILLLGDFSIDGDIIRKRNEAPYPVAVVGTGGSTTPTNTPPNPNFTTIINDLTVTFTNTSTDADAGDNVTVVSWDFGDGSTSTASNPTHVYDASGSYDVTLTVSDGTETNSATKTVTVSSGTTPGEGVAPVISSWDWIDTSNPAMKRVQVTWSVTDDDGDLKEVVSTLTDPAGKIVSTTTTVTSFSASGVHELSFKKGISGSYSVTTVVKDQSGNTDPATDTRTATIEL